jgi:hypothetical protein
LNGKIGAAARFRVGGEHIVNGVETSGRHGVENLLHNARDSGKRQAAVQERAYSHFIGSIERAR